MGGTTSWGLSGITKILGVFFFVLTLLNVAVRLAVRAHLLRLTELVSPSRPPKLFDHLSRNRSVRDPQMALSAAGAGASGRSPGDAILITNRGLGVVLVASHLPLRQDAG